MPTPVFRSTNPATEQPIGEYAVHDSAEVEKRLVKAAAAFGDWRREDVDGRATLLKSAAGVLRSRRQSLAHVVTAEMGKPLVEAMAEVDKCAAACDWFAIHGPDLLANRPIELAGHGASIRFDPLGPVLAVMPWNFPLWQVFRFAAPAVMSGNVAVLKHAPNVCGCAVAIKSVFDDAGFPPGVLTNLRIEIDAVKAVIASRHIVAVTLTGSERAGRAVGAAAGKALKKAVLELGGSDPFIVLSDADVVATARAAAAARCANGGQSCIAAKRFLVDEKIADEFESAFSIEMAELKVGDPLVESTKVGPLARRDLVAHLTDQVARSVTAGARVVVGGHGFDRGYFYAPAVLADVTPGMAVFDEETFGPVAAVCRAAGEHELVALANRSRYGLGASVWTADPDRALRLAPLLDVGQVFVNTAVRSDPAVPFGGVKASGYGRELSFFGLHEFVNVKSVVTKK